MNENETSSRANAQGQNQESSQIWSEEQINEAVQQSAGENKGGEGGAESVEQTVAETPTPQAGLTPEQIKDLITTTAKSLQPVQQAPQKEMTLEEFNRIFNVFQVTPDVVNKLGLQETAVPVLHDVLQAVVRQAVTMAEHRIRALTGEVQKHFEQSLTPLQQYYKEQQEQQYAKEFLEQNQDLVGAEPLLQSIYAQLKAENRSFATKQEAFKEVADRARTVLKQLKNAGAAQQQKNVAETAAPSGRRMSTLTSGGQGATGKAGGSTTSAKAIFG